jgi:hypothetical protein
VPPPPAGGVDVEVDDDGGWVPPLPLSDVVAPVAPVLAGVVVAGVLVVSAGVVVAGVLVVSAGVVVAGVLVVVAVVVEPLETLVDPVAAVGPRLSSVLVVVGVRLGEASGALSVTVVPPHAASATALSVAAPSSASERRVSAITPRREACVDRTSGSR